MAVDPKQYAEQLLQEAGVSDEAQRKAFLDVFSNEKASKRLADDVMMHQDYARSMDALRKKEAESVSYYQKLLGWENDVKANAEKLAQYEAVYGDLNGRSPVQPVQPDLSTFEKKWQDELAKRDQQRDAQMVSLLKDGMFLASQHAVEFREPLDTEALAKIAMEKGKTLRDAYSDMVAPAREKRAAEARAAEVKQKVEEAVRDYAAQHHIPVDAAAKEYHPIFDRDTTKQVEYVPNTGRLTPNGERTLKQSFVDEWNAAGAKTSGT